MKTLKVLAGALLLSYAASGFASQTTAKLYKNPNCGCCGEYAKYMERNGFDVEVIDTEELTAIKTERDVPEELFGCHTTLVGNYLFEGHVPVDIVNTVLEEKPFIRGLSVPGMPAGSPGMGGTKRGPIDVYALNFAPVQSKTVYTSF